jgi:hypothetical protein
MDPEPSSRHTLTPGTSVQVFSRFSISWINGFEIATGPDHDGYQLRRLSDHSVLPKRFPIEDLRPQHRDRR